MNGYVWRRAAGSLTLLAALLALAGGVLVWIGAPIWLPVALAAVIVVAQWAVGPALLGWLIPAREIARAGDGYDSELPVAAMVARRCADARVPLVRLGVVDDGTPNAFTFGHTRRDARVYVTRGLLERLDDDELDAVVAHEIGHVRQNDFIVMAVAAIVPLVLYYAFLVARRSNDGRALPVAVGAYVAYLVAQLALLGLSRARELSADHWSCQVTGHGDALATALVKVGYGMGEVDAERERHTRVLMARKDKGAKKAWRKEQARYHRTRAAGVFGIADPRQGVGLHAAQEQGLAPREVVGALRWETCNPWARFQQLLSTHPLVVRRIAVLESSGLPGAPRGWETAETASACEGPDLAAARRRFPVEVLVRLAPLAAFVVLVGAWGAQRWQLLAQALTVLGVALLVRAAFVSRPGPSEPVDRIASLLERLDASPVTGLPVSIRGKVIGRGTPGYVLSPDVVVQDESGFVAVAYRQPWPFARSLFGLLRVPDLAGQEVLVRGWYRRAPGPVLELRELTPAMGPRVRGFLWVARFALGAALLLVGGAAWLAQTL